MARSSVLLSRDEAAALLEVSPDYFTRMCRRDETFIPVQKIADRISYYKRSDILQFKKTRDKKASGKKKTSTTSVVD